MHLRDSRDSTIVGVMVEVFQTIGSLIDELKGWEECCIELRAGDLTATMDNKHGLSVSKRFGRPAAEEAPMTPIVRLVRRTSALRAWHADVVWTERTCDGAQKERDTLTRAQNGMKGDLARTKAKAAVVREQFEAFKTEVRERSSRRGVNLFKLTAQHRDEVARFSAELFVSKTDVGELRTELEAVRRREQEHVDEVTSLNAEVASLRADLAAAKEKMETIARIASCAPLKRRRTASDTDIDTETE